MNKLFTKSLCIALLAMVLGYSGSYAQVVVNESFNFSPTGTVWPNTDLPFGWSQIKLTAGVDANNFWERINNTATLPTCTPRTGVGMMRFKSQLALAGSQSALVSRPFDMRNIPGGGATVSFWMYRDNGNVGANDNIQIAYNTVSNLTGATFLNAPSPNVINRPCSSAPAVGCLASYNVANWYQYTYTIPMGAANANLYIFLVATTAGGGQNIYIDDFTINTYPNAQAYTTSALSFQNLANVGQNSMNNMVIGTRITVDGEATPMFLDSILLNTNGCSSPNTDLVANSAKLWYTGGTPQFAILNAIQLGPNVAVNNTNMGFRMHLNTSAAAGAGAVTLNFASTTGVYVGMLVRATAGIAANTVVTAVAAGSVTLSNATTAAIAAGSTIRFAFPLTQGNNHFWLTYDVAPNPTSTPGNCIDADFISATLNNTVQTPSPQTVAGCREIDVVYCGGATPFYSVGTSWLNGSYTNNDYVQNVQLVGLAGYPAIASGPPNNNYGPPIAPWNGGKAPFSNHPPDYELFSVDSVGKTTTLQVAEGALCNTTAGSNIVAFPGGVPAMAAIGAGISVPGAVVWPTTNGSVPVTITAIGVNQVTISVNATATLAGVMANVGNAYYIQLQVGTWTSSNYIAAWINYNKDLAFTNTMWTLGGEKISQSVGLSSNGWHRVYFQVPYNAVLGKNTLRVREIYATSNCDPCASATYGETEDYGINIVGFCGVPGWKTWLGFTNDWTTPSNWCPAGVPTVANNVRIPGSGAAGYTRPVIKAGVNAVCNKLRIEGADTLYIDAYQNGGLTAGDSIFIQDPQGMIKVISSYNNTAVMGIGTLYNNNFTPVKNIRSQKMQFVYTQAELLAKGMVAGDRITQIIIPVTSLGTGSHTYNNFNINYYYTNPFFCFASSAPPQAPVVTPGGNLYTGTPTFAVGDNAFTLSGLGLVWSGSANNLVIEICYANPAGAFAIERVDQTQTLGCRSAAFWGDLTGATAGCALTSAANPKNSTDQRSNLKFVFDRPYSKVPIALAGHWGNNGTFTAGFSKVTFNGTNPQNIAGASNTSFYDLVINNSNALGVAQVTAATLIGDTLNLINGPFRLNGLTFTHNNNLSTSVIRTNGWLQSENTGPAYGRFLWRMGNETTPHVFPFGTGAGVANYLPFTFTPTGGTGVEVDMATYLTPANNTPFPTGVPAIQNFYTGADNSANMVDRYWQIDLAGAGTTGTMLFSYRNAEIAANGNVNPRAQRWQTATSRWTDPSTFASQTNPTATQVQVTGVNQSGPWAISIQAQPLPVELLSFSAKKEKDRVKLLWSTASELNNDYFTVERTQNHHEFSFIDKVESRGPSTSILDYYTYDYRPLNGLQYYRLKQTDYDGTTTYSKLVPVTFGKENFEIVAVSSQPNDVRNVLFNYDNDGQVGIRLVDIMGKTVYEKSNFKTIDGINQFELNTSLPSGIFTIFIYDNSRLVSRKIVF